MNITDDDTRPGPFHKLVSCIKERRLPDTLLAFVERQQETYGPSYYRRIQDRLLRQCIHSPSYLDIKEICRQALEDGNTISMDGIVYGPAHWEKTGILNRAPQYYNFLAGFVHSQNIKTIVEIGTWYGGSTRAMLRGWSSLTEKGLIVTVDPIQRNLTAFQAHPEIIAIEGDSAQDQVVHQVAKHLAPRIDMIFIDGDHRYEPTKAVIEKYGNMFKPRWMVFDDIHFRWRMEKVWAYALKNYPGLVYDAGNDLGFQTGKGFGVIDCRDVKHYKL